MNPVDPVHPESINSSEPNQSADHSGSILKLRRAAFHSQELTKFLQRFVESKPCTFVIEPSPDPPEFEVRAKINHPFPSADCGAIVGDLVHNARCALDYLVYATSTARVKRHQLKFPICDDLARFVDSKARALCGVPEPYVAVVERCQPFQPGSDISNEVLAFLREISNTDKHKLVPVVSVLGQLKNIKLDGGIEASADALFEVEYASGGKLRYDGIDDGTVAEDGAVMGRLRVEGPCTTIQAQPRFAFLFGNEIRCVEGLHMTPLLDAILRRVGQVVNDFLMVSTDDSPRPSP